MRYTRIDVESGTGMFASMTRKRDGKLIEVEVLSPSGATRLSCRADDAAEQEALALRLEREIETPMGDNLTAIRLLAD